MNRAIYASAALFFSLAAILAASSPATNANSVNGSAIVDEMNRARQQPAAYAEYVKESLAEYNGKYIELPGHTRIYPKEGTRAFDEAIRFLRSARPEQPLALSHGLSHATADHCADQVDGSIGHDGHDRSNPGSRISRYGAWTGAWGENIAYGKTSARDVVLALIIDDGIAGRKHRKNIFNPKFNVAGAAYGPHARYRTVCTIDFAGGYIERGQPASQLVARNND
jgi:uncharacterized protein YkwD